MVTFFRTPDDTIFAIGSNHVLSPADLEKFQWLIPNSKPVTNIPLHGPFVGPRKEMITPWSTNAVEICLNMNISGVQRIEKFEILTEEMHLDPMLQRKYEELNEKIFEIKKDPDPIIYIDDISNYNKNEGLALSMDEIEYLESVSKALNRKLSDSEVFGFSQVNSEHCRHKIFNGSFVIDGVEKEHSLFSMIKKTSEENPNLIVSAYKDNVAFIQGPEIEQFAPKRHDIPDFFELRKINSVISLKAETHNFPTTVEPFNGAATGSGGEIRDRMAGGIGSIPIAGTAVYMTSYSRLEDSRDWEDKTQARNWLYQTPSDILIKASNGASDFGNKFGQPLICGSVLTFEWTDEQKKTFAFDKVIMMAGGVGFANFAHAQKNTPKKGDKIVILGGDNYRIGMGGGAVSSVATGEYQSSIELNAVQRSNPEMQKRAYNAIRALAESKENPIISIHDHGAGGHLNCLSELVENNGGTIYMDQLPIGDPTLSDKEIIGNESQERMGLVLDQKDIDLLKKIADRERAPMYVVGDISDDQIFCFQNKNGDNPIDLKLEYLFGKPPKTRLTDSSKKKEGDTLSYSIQKLNEYLEKVLQLEAVACKDWLTNKVDRSVTGRIALQQSVGEIQLPLNNLAICALDYTGFKGIATSIGHAPAIGLISPSAGSFISIAEALTNLVWTPLTHGLKGVSLSANWMWPCKNENEDARLYEAVEAAASFAIQLGINIPTGKDSLSMTQKYPDGKIVYSPGTVIISSVAETSDFRKAVSPAIKKIENSEIIYISFSDSGFPLGGSSFAQILGRVGEETPLISNPQNFVKCFEAIQKLIDQNLILAGHDVSSGGLIGSLLEMLFAVKDYGLNIQLDAWNENDLIKILFCEKPSVIIQIADKESVIKVLNDAKIEFSFIGKVVTEPRLKISHSNHQYDLDVAHLRDKWYYTSYLLDRKQSGEKLAQERFNNYKKQSLEYIFPKSFSGSLNDLEISPISDKEKAPCAAIIREKGVNGDREMAFMLHLAGFKVKDVHITDLIAGREDLQDVNFIVFVGGFSNSDVLGSAKGWAGAFLFNAEAKKSLDAFYQRKDTLSLGVCNGCQLMVELGVLNPGNNQNMNMVHNDSHKFESSFLTVNILKNETVLLKELSDTRLGVWVAHGEGKFILSGMEQNHNIVMKYAHAAYPGNPNGSDFSAAAISSQDGRHLAMMPHLERAFYAWHWPHYPAERKNDRISPWMIAFVQARKWIEKKNE